MRAPKSADCRNMLDCQPHRDIQGKEEAHKTQAGLALISIPKRSYLQDTAGPAIMCMPIHLYLHSYIYIRLCRLYVLQGKCICVACHGRFSICATTHNIQNYITRGMEQRTLYQVLRDWYLGPSTRYHVFGTRHLAPNICDHATGTKHLVLPST